MSYKNAKVHVVVFSRNRAAQLDLLFRSMRRFCLFNYALTVIYRADSNDFASGYRQLRKYASDQKDIEVHFVDENEVVPAEGGCSFYAALRAALHSHTECELTMFLVDDDVFCDRTTPRTARFELLDNESVETLSLRLGPNVTYCYPMDINMAVPDLSNGAFQWRDKSGCWGYCMSLDGNLYRSRRVRHQICEELGEQKGPNMLEHRLNVNIVGLLPYMAVASRQLLFNIPHNRVEGSFNNRCEGGDPVSLNRKFVLGGRLDLIRAIATDRNAAHCPSPLVFM